MSDKNLEGWQSVIRNELTPQPAAAAPREPAPAVGWASLVSLVADFLKDRDQALTPDKATDEERRVSAKLIAEIFAIDAPPAPHVDAVTLEALRCLDAFQPDFVPNAMESWLQWRKAALAAIQSRRQQGGE